MNELEFLRARVKELRCENKLLLETKFQMEEQNLLNEKRIRSLVDLEEQLDQYKRHLESISFVSYGVNEIVIFVHCQYCLCFQLCLHCA